VKRECLRERDFLAEISVSGTSFVLVLSAPRSTRPVDYAMLSVMRERVRRELLERIAARFPPEVSGQFECSIGCVVINAIGSVPVNRLILRGLDAAYGDAYGERDRALQERRAALEDIIGHRLISTVYQPIVDLVEERVLGYEAFARGPAGELENPEYLFELAAQTKLVWQLERLCREAAATGLAMLSGDELLFLNIDAESIFDPNLGWRAALEGFGGRVVLELTERAAISDFRLFQRVLDQVRQVGLQFAIDDVGSAHSSLRLIAEARPNFIKLDMAITRGLHLDDIRRELVRLLLHLAESIGSRLIVEGVETAQDLQALREIGVRYVQGFLFGKPQPQLAPLDVRSALALIGAGNLIS
jgi:EAL domain-containing protein (putative c-di-GMP-specific phosphodiesterase class I)